MLNEAKDENPDIPNLPFKWESNTNLIAEPLLNEQEIINLIVRFMIGTYVPKNSYVVDQTVSPETESFFKVYTSQNESDERFNPLLVTIQSEINEASMVDIVQYCALVAERFKYLPTVLIIANKESLGSNEQNRHLVKLKSTFWAEKCLMFLSDLYITPLNNQPRNAFYALCQFLSHPDKKFSLSSDVENQSINLVVENSM